jgi:hypothetical protein
MYLIFQVASDDETTQCKGLVALYTLHDNSAISFVQLALHTTECKKFFDAVPLRYSAIHCFTNDDMSVILGIIFNMIGKGRNLRMRANIGAYFVRKFFISWLSTEGLDLPWSFSVSSIRAIGILLLSHCKSFISPFLFLNFGKLQ